MFLQRHFRHGFALIALLIALFALSSVGMARQFSVIERVNVASNGAQTNNGQRPVISDDGRFVAFWSDSAALVPNDTNNTADIFVHDRNDNVTSRVNITNTGQQTNALTFAEIDINGDGRLVAFASDATNLITGDNNNTTDIFVFDRGVAQIARISNPSATPVGANGPSFAPLLSGDGRFVAFWSYSSNLLPGDTNNQVDLYLFDRVPNPLGQLARVNLTNTGEQAQYGNIPGNSAPRGAAALSGDGRYVAFDSVAINLVNNDTNSRADVFVRDRVNNTTRRVSVATDRSQGNGDSTNPAISDNGRWVAFVSRATNLVEGDTNGRADVFLYDYNNRTTIRISNGIEGAQANGDSALPTMSADGRYISFWSNASNLVPGDANGLGDLFVYDRVSQTITLATINTSGQQTNGQTQQFASISGNGKFIAFESLANNLVPNDTNNSNDIFVALGGPNPPSGLTATPLSETSIQLNWADNATDETAYIVQRTRSDTFNTIAQLPPNTTTFTDTGRPECTEFRYRVIATDGVTNAFSNVITTRTLGCPPGAFTITLPENDETIVNTATFTSLRWSASAEAQTYTVVLQRLGTNPALILNENVPATICDASGVCAYTISDTLRNQLINASYSLSVSANNARGTTAASNQPVLFAVDDTLPPRVFGLRSPANNALIRFPETITELVWRSNRDAATYDVVLINISNNPQRLGVIIDEQGLTPAADADALTCEASNTNTCVFSLSSAEQDALDTGAYSWTVIATGPGGGRTEANGAPWQFSVETRDIDLVVNGSFEIDSDSDGLPDGWTLLNGTNDRIRCNRTNRPNNLPDKIFARTGNCAFQMSGAPGDNSRLDQLLPTSGLQAGDIITFGAWVNGRNIVGQTVLQVRVRYNDPAIPRMKINVPIAGGTYAYALFTGNVTLASSDIRDIRLRVIGRNTQGRMIIDDVSAIVLGPGTRSEVPDAPAPLPLPQTFSDFSGQ